MSPLCEGAIVAAQRRAIRARVATGAPNVEVPIIAPSQVGMLVARIADLARDEVTAADVSALRLAARLAREYAGQAMRELWPATEAWL
jgi:hypothetical protein